MRMYEYICMYIYIYASLAMQFYTIHGCIYVYIRRQVCVYKYICLPHELPNIVILLSQAAGICKLSFASARVSIHSYRDGNRQDLHVASFCSAMLPSSANRSSQELSKAISAVVFFPHAISRAPAGASGWRSRSRSLGLRLLT